MVHKDYRLIALTPIITAGAYLANDQVGGLLILSDILGGDRGHALLQSLAVIDKASQNAPLSVFFFDDYPTLVSADNDAFQVSDSEMALKCLGAVTVAATDYQASSANSVATLRNIGLLLKGNNGSAGGLIAGTTRKDLFAVVKTTGTPTYASVGDLTFKFGLESG